MFLIKFDDGMGKETTKITDDKQLFNLFPEFYQAVL